MRDRYTGSAGYGEGTPDASAPDALSMADVALLQALQYAEVTPTLEDDLMALMQIAGTDHALSPVTLREAAIRAASLTRRGEISGDLAFVIALLMQRVIAAGLTEAVGPTLVEAGRVLLAGPLTGSVRLTLGVTTAQTLMRLGRVDVASRLSLGLRPYVQSANDRLQLARAEADLLYDLHERDRAAKVLTEALEIAQGADESERLLTLSSVLAAWPTGRPGLERWLDETRRTADQMNEPHRTGALLHVLTLLRAAGRLDHARQVATSIDMSTFRAVAGPQLQPWIDEVEQLVANTLQSPATTAPTEASRLALSGDFRAAGDAFLEAATQSRARGFRIHAFDNLAAAGKFYQMAGQNEDALRAFDEAFALFEHDIVYLPSASNVISRLASWPEAYTRAALAALALNDPARAVDFAETGRSRAIGNRIGPSDRTRPPSAPADLWHRYVRGWRAAVARAASQLIDSGGADSTVDVRDEELDELRSELLASGAQPEQITPLVQPVKAADVVQRLASAGIPTTVLYSIRLGDSQLRFVRLSHEGAHELPLDPADQQAILRACDDYVATLRAHRGEMHRLVARKTPELVRTVGSPLGAVLDRALTGQPEGRLLWIPQGTLVAIALAACPIGGQTLVDRAAVVVAPSLTMAVAATEPDSTVSRHFIAVRGPANGQAPTDGGDRVVSVLAQQPSDDVIPHSVSELNAAVAGASLVHVTCHGVYDWDDPLRSHLVLGSDISIEALFDEGRLDTDSLVLFGTCDSGTIAQGDINEAIGLPTACIGVGARTVVGAGWPVARSAAVATCLAFVRGLRDGQASVEALQSATVHVRGLTLAQLQIELEEVGHPLARSAGFRTLLAKQPNDRAFESPYLWASYVHWGGGWRLADGRTDSRSEEQKVNVAESPAGVVTGIVPMDLVGNWSQSSTAPGASRRFQYRIAPDGSYELEGAMRAGDVSFSSFERGRLDAGTSTLTFHPSERWTRQPDGRTTQPHAPPRQYGWQVAIDPYGSVVLVLISADGQQDVFYRR
jgi:tetratricopeptide (TPR) repeat protein